ncbi:cobyrinate a,c-diamide synthase [Novosphingobium umbonatum]|uniref:Cobyrinate a,c-diamide synthase n=1 Tax=Novosphingobium umbonatum TaxID=1908524 RepID=A0A437N7B7_9SPHN|nr:cobyrinate a,c-diamide synthase [Novosphingobium umbonatum]RVU05812.1 cobyrinate a,c-diamide synthase [Novosphingobium umbonatum]
MKAAHCPTLLVAAPASGQGKTLVTAALARRHRQAGRRVSVFKCGPDFLDPMVLERASGAPVYQLDLFMLGEEQCRAQLHKAASQSDLILIEGVMGLFDGDRSAADLAALFGLPVLAVLDASAMAQSFGALVHGLASYRRDVHVAAVLANRVGSARHAQMLEQSLIGNVQWLGHIPRDPAIALPERHLGLVQAEEIADLDARIDYAASLLPDNALWLPPSAPFPAPAPQSSENLLSGRRIAIARDAAFAFIYPANLDWLEQMGASLHFFSPLVDRLPDCDALWLPGGYPELHGDRLSANSALTADIRAHHQAGKPILAECGGMLACLDRLYDGQGQGFEMLGILSGEAHMQPRLAALGLQAVAFPKGILRGHTFHFSRLSTCVEPIAQATNPNGGAGEAIFRQGSLLASYVHFYFPSAPHAAAALFLDN